MVGCVVALQMLYLDRHALQKRARGIGCYGALQMRYLDGHALQKRARGYKTATEINLSNSSTAENAAYPKIIVGNETKTIIGFNCTKISTKGEDGAEATLWVTKELIAPLKGQQQFGNIEIEGVPLEFSTINNGMTIHFIATKFDANVDPNVFSMEIPQGYTIVTEEELKNMGG